MSAKALMRLWGTVIIGHTGAAPDTTLLLFDPDHARSLE